jgi:hypothetical protein
VTPRWLSQQRYSRNQSKTLVRAVGYMTTQSELDAYFTERQHGQFIGGFIRKYANMNDVIVKLGSDEADKERLFVSPRLWSLFFVLRGLYGRTALLISNSYNEGRFVDWRVDGGCDQLLRAFMPAKLLERVRGQPIGGLQTAFEFLEAQFVAEAGMNITSVD